MSEDYPRTMLEMERRFNTEDDCRKYLFALRWPQGWSCPRCGARRAGAVRRGLWQCHECRFEASIITGTIFQGSHLPLTTWFRAIWRVTCNKNGISALGLKRTLGLGSYKTAWAMLHKLRRAMVRPGRERLRGLVEVDDTYWGGEEEGVIGHLTYDKALIVVAAEQDGKGIGRIRLGRVPNLTKRTLHGFIAENVEPGSVVRTDGLNAYLGLDGYVHDRRVQSRPEDADHLLPMAHRVISLLKRWLLGTHQGAIGLEHLCYYLDEFTFRFNRRKSASRGKLFYRLMQQAVQLEPTPFSGLIKPQSLGECGVK
jgi:transposase-like protein